MRLHKSKVFLVLLVSFVAGIGLRSFVNIETVYLLSLLVLSVIIFTAFYEKSLAMLAGAALAVFALGIWRTDVKLAVIEHTPLDGKEFSGKAIVVQKPEEKEFYKRVVVEIAGDDNICHSERNEQAERANEVEESQVNDKIGCINARSFTNVHDDRIRILVYTNLHESINYGDVLNINCRMQKPENFADDFDWQMYLAKDNILYQCEKPKITVVGSGEGNPILSFLFSVSDKLESNINRALPQPEAALAAGLLLGGSSRLPKETAEQFSRTGMTHIVAVSGYNVTIIAHYLMLMGVVLGLWRRQAFYFALAGIFLFVAMIGFPSSGVRAAVMGMLLLWAIKNGRLANSFGAVVLSAAVMLFINPSLLRWDVGFQLSFLATLGIISFYPLFQKLFIFKTRAAGVSEILFLTISAQIFVVPIIAYNFHQVSLLSLLANLAILPIVPVTMLFVFLSGIVAFLWQPLSLAFAWTGYLFLHYEIGIVEFISSISWSAVGIEQLKWWWAAMWYTILVVIVFLIKKRTPRLITK